MNKKNLTLAGILVLLIAMAYIYQGPYQDWRQKQDNNFLQEVGGQNAVRLEVQQADGDNVAVLEKDDQGWKIAGSKELYIKNEAEEGLEDIWERIQDSSFELVSSNKDKKEEFNTGDNGVLVTLHQDRGSALEFVVGKSGPDYSSSYISRPGIEETYLVDLDLSRVFKREQWGDPVIFESEKGDVNRLRLQYPDRELIVVKQDDGWQGIEPYSFNVSEDKIDEILNVMVDLEAVTIPEQTFEGTGLEKHLIIAEAGGEDKNNTLMIGEANEDGLYYAKKAKSDNIYLVASEVKDTLEKTIAQLQ
jgi:hypothetical protein